MKYFICCLYLILYLSIPGYVGSNRNSSGGMALSFDDYFSDNWLAYEPLLKKYRARVTFYVCCWQTMTPLQKQKLVTLQQAGHEIAFHTSQHLSALSYLKTYSITEYLNREIFPDLKQMREYGLLIENFAYPYGEFTHQSDSALTLYFRTLRKTTQIEQSGNFWKEPSYFIRSSLRLQHFNAGNIDNQAALQKEKVISLLNETVKDKKILVLSSHYISNREGDFFITPEMLRFILQEATKRNLTFYRTKDLYNSQQNTFRPDLRNR